ncbi:LysR family transcriptional regulator [Alginatibacterium sediminis]|uniref:LysR family transcriptional regulator n=1 Tax=Alginatibacterium sediminis TaxID=2164068 RepID=A0A420ED08_9ALTE|nr:LysR family transcriptional regulator [Alginatibacterium sediminis]RKF18587.1 LysR family transcriptional regulator [Alginatibacterium sediminis]
MIRSDDLILFALVVDQQSFSAAASVLGISNSVVSKRLAKLEQELGVQLLFRSTRQLRLSDAGKTLYQRAKTIANMSQEAVAEITGLGDKLQGKIRISVPTISGELLLAQSIAAFCQLHPQLEIDLTLENHLVDLIGDEYDLAIRTASLESSNLIARHIIDSSWVVCASPKYLHRSGVPELPSHLHQHQCLLYSFQESGARDWLFHGDDGVIVERINGQFRSNNARALRDAALQNYGLIYVPRCLVYEDLQAGRLIQILKSYSAKTLGIYAVYPFTRQQPKKIKLLIEHIRQSYLDKHEYF